MQEVSTLLFFSLNLAVLFCCLYEAINNNNKNNKIEKFNYNFKTGRGSHFGKEKKRIIK
jgi:hypothetical protein